MNFEISGARTDSSSGS